MTSDQTVQLAPAAPKRCGYCPLQVTWMETYDGHMLCFDAKPVLRANDHQKLGWIPGQLLVGDQTRTVWAPLAEHPSNARRRHRVVWHLHECPGLSPRTVAA